MNQQQKASWIWYPGDYEHWLHRKVSVLRQFRGYISPPYWRLDSAYSNVAFRKKFNLQEQEVLTLAVQGSFVVLMDDDMIPVSYEKKPITSIVIPPGEHVIKIMAYTDEAVPAIYAYGQTVGGTDSSWEVTCHDGDWKPAACWAFQDIHQPPGEFPFAYETVEPVSVKRYGDKTVVDFGRETFGYVTFTGMIGTGKVILYYGESLEEALAGEEAETFDELEVDCVTPTDYRTQVTRAFRYIQLQLEPGLSYKHILHEYEYLPIVRRGAFRCSDDGLNRIWEISAQTIHMNTREFLYDGMKRDRWVWSGDANLGALINNYIFFDADVVKRTIVALRGKDPVTRHINTIMDFTFHWFHTLDDYYMYTGDLDFVQACYPKLLTLIEFCLGRRNAEGMMEGLSGDWVFIDWADMEREGEVCAEQILFCHCLDISSKFAGLMGDAEHERKFAELATRLREKIFELFWNEDKGGLMHGRWNGEIIERLLKYPNMFALRFGYLSPEQQDIVRRRVLLDDTVQKIKTPFMRFFEMEALCEIGEQHYVLQEMKRYWGGMLDLGATSFWEEFDPGLPANEQYDMYGGKFRKSLCHAWGAAPIYLLGKYYLGVRPEAPGYARYCVEPKLGELEWISGEVPTPHGEVSVYMDASSIRVTTARSGIGRLRFNSKTLPRASHGELRQVAEDEYELCLTLPDHAYTISLT
ncbi:alpha-L-rhamnosidase-related protein [Cohnella herbarum]|uniref:Alpha-rhamnosidase n=1 Tax=Cohnella herbarum TaxID=2728023 RepID=A0A7Z2VKL6_9BACL|nr:alpha-L-rhamnosidase C-terminal domain-containing protein [Cohnella herbarum]QJD84700.1 alpha-rhamnosidase [Cohnella herbarum]